MDARSIRKREPQLSQSDPWDQLPDVRDGLTRLERIILWVLHESKKDFDDRAVPTATVYGRVVEYINVGVPEFQKTLQRLTGKG